MTPVDDENTRDCEMSRTLATADVTASVASMPLRPVNALALPELTMIARAAPSPPRQSWTGQSKTGAETGA